MLDQCPGNAGAIQKGVGADHYDSDSLAEWASLGGPEPDDDVKQGASWKNGVTSWTHRIELGDSQNAHVALWRQSALWRESSLLGPMETTDGV